MENNVFFSALKNNYRFDFRGTCTTEDLFDLKVEDLDSIYKRLKKLQKEATEDSLLVKTNKEDKILNEKIEIVRAIVEDKMIEKERAQNAAKKRAQKQKILEIMNDKKDAALRDKSIEELQAMLEEE